MRPEVNARYGKWTLLERGVYEGVQKKNGKSGKHTAWKCRCDCGKVKEAVRQDNIVAGSSRSCGCDKKRVHQRVMFELTREAITTKTTEMGHVEKEKQQLRQPRQGT